VNYLSVHNSRSFWRRLAFGLIVGAWAVWGLNVLEAADRTWRWSNPLPHGNNIAGLAALPNQLYVQVADHGQLYTSTDLTRWEFRETGTRKALRGAAFLGSRLVVGGEQGTILWADDPQEINRIDLGTEDWIEGVATSPTVAVAVGDNGAIYRSENGTNWVRQAVSFNHWLRGVIWGGGTFVAVGDADGVFTSPDGRGWTQQTVTGGRGSNLNKGGWTGDGFVIAGDAIDGKGTVLVGSADGQNWTLVDPTSKPIRDLITASGSSTNFFIVAGDLELHRFSSKLPNRWSSLISNEPTDGPPPAIYLSSLWDGTRFLFGGRTGRTVSAEPTSLSLTWNEFSSPPRSWLFDLTLATAFATNVTAALTDGQTNYLSTRTTNTFFAAAGDYATLLTSDAGVSWSPSLPPINAADRTYLGIATQPERLVAVGSRGLISVSPVAYEPLIERVRLTNNAIVSEVLITNEVNTLGLLWYAANSPTDQDLQAICATPALFVVGGDQGFLATSTDGTNWTRRVSGTTAFLSGLEASADGFVAVGDQGTILTSPDALTWTRQKSPSAQWIYRVRRGGDGAWVAVGEGGTILTSTNRETWTLRTTGTTAWLNDAEWANGTWFVVGNQGTVLTSTNAVDWILDPGLITGKSLYATATWAGRLVTAGVDGVILRTRVSPFSNAVNIVRYPGTPSDNLFQFSGEPDQILRVDRATSLDQVDKPVQGPMLEITRPDGNLLYFDPTLNDPTAQLFLAPNLN